MVFSARPIGNVKTGGRRSVVISDPPLGKGRIRNLYFDPDTNKLVIDYEDVPESYEHE